MTEATAELVVLCAGGYLCAGVFCAALLLVTGFKRIDPSAGNAPLGFKLIVLPGLVVLWPFMAWRWLRNDGHPPEERSPHLRPAQRKS